jgi:hypothetical protein
MLMIIGGIRCRSQDSAGKRTIEGPYFEDQENSRKILGNYIFPEDSGSQKEESRGAMGPSRQGGAAWPLAVPALCEAALAHLWHRLFTYFIISKNLSQGGVQS